MRPRLGQGAAGAARKLPNARQAFKFARPRAFRIHKAGARSLQERLRKIHENALGRQRKAPERHARLGAGHARAHRADLEHLTAQLLTNEDGSPTALARETGARFYEIMVDEYQDVNSVQDEIFRALSRDGNNLFMVGDVKQSIYRFRLADPLIFTDKYEKYAFLLLEIPL